MVKKTPVKKKDKLLIGWNEWCGLPQLGIPAIKAKIDTGAKTSSLHAFNIETIIKDDVKYACFHIHPLQGNIKIDLKCECPVIDERFVMSSNGHIEHRLVILTELQLGAKHWNIQLTLSNRDPLKFRMLLGREALNGRVLIDPFHSMRQGKFDHQELLKIYRK